MFLYPGEPPFPHAALQALLSGMPKHPGEYYLGSKELVATHPATNPTFKVGQEVLFRRLLDEKEGDFTPWKRGVVEFAGEGGELLGLQNSVYSVREISGRCGGYTRPWADEIYDPKIPESEPRASPEVVRARFRQLKKCLVPVLVQDDKQQWIWEWSPADLLYTMHARFFISFHPGSRAHAKIVRNWDPKYQVEPTWVVAYNPHTIAYLQRLGQMLSPQVLRGLAHL